MNSEKVTGDVLNHHLESFGKRDVDLLMEDYTEDSIVVIPDATLKGLDQIRGLMTKFTTELLPAGASFEMLKSEIHGNVAYIVWKAESDAFKFPIATDTFVVTDGKIAIQTFAAQVEPK